MLLLFFKNISASYNNSASLRLGMFGLRSLGLRFLLLTMVLLASCASLLAAENLPDESESLEQQNRVLQVLQDWIHSDRVHDPQRSEALQQWKQAFTPTDPPTLFPLTHRLDNYVQTVALANPQVQDLLQYCEQPALHLNEPQFSWLLSNEYPVSIQANLRLYLARYYVQHRYYDEGLIQLNLIKIQDAISPVELLFYRAVAQHQLVDLKNTRNTLDELLEYEEQLPRRFQNLLQLMLKDTEGLQNQSLNHASRQMKDIDRRLQKGRSGKKVQNIEENVIKTLDKLIEQEEKKEKKKQFKPGSGQGNKPMKESRITKMKGAGRVDQKPIGNKSGWGDLPPKEREKAMQQIGREFPSHYRDVVEEYFRKLAGEEAIVN